MIQGIHYASGKAVMIEHNAGLISNVDELSNVEMAGLPFVAPGFIDNQVNGFAGVDFSANDLTPEGVRVVTEALWKSGVTTYFPTLITNSHANLIRNFGILSAALEDKMISSGIPGFHLEGPYISALEGYRGCHPLQHIRNPSWQEFQAYQSAARGRIIQVTLAPEIEGAVDFIRQCVKNSVKVGIAHTSASSDQINAAIEAGASFSTHLGNGCPTLLPRHLNPIWFQLANDKLIPSIIVDGHHLPREIVSVIYTVKGPRRLLLTSDVVHLSGMPPGRYRFASGDVDLLENGKLVSVGADTLAGASFSLLTGVENIMRFTNCSLAQAIDMASKNLAVSYGLADRGELLPGKRADLAVFDKVGDRIELKETYVMGQQVFRTMKTQQR